MKKKILIVAPYTSYKKHNLPNRFSLIAEELQRRGNDVTVVSSNFFHRKKEEIKDLDVKNEIYKVILIKTKKYKRNFSISRIINILDFEKNFKKEFKNLRGYDIVYCSYPMIGTCYHVASIKDKFKLIIDIQDIWPEAIFRNLNLPSFLNFLLIGVNRKKIFSFKSADAVISVSNTYLEAYKPHINTLKKYVYYLGSDFAGIGRLKRKDGLLRMFYLGTISHSYDLETVCRAVHEVNRHVFSVEFSIFGDGPDRQKLQEKSYKGVCFEGMRNYDELKKIISGFDCAVNSIVAGAAQSITNKLSDYLALGIPILNSQELPELLAMEKRHTLVNYSAGDVSGLVRALSSTESRSRLQDKWRPNKDFDRSTQIRRICDVVEGLESSA